MIFSQILRAQQAVNDRLSKITKTAGGQYDTVFRPIVSEGFEPQQPVELMSTVQGYTRRDNSPIGFDDVDLHITVEVLCSRSLAGESLSIEQISMQVCADVERVLMADVTQSGNCINTRLGDAEAQDALDQGYYGWMLSVYFHVRAREDDPFSQS